MKKLRLVRVASWGGATLGILLVDGKPECKTLELPWRNNREDFSCVPVGVYRCVKYSSPKHGRVLMLQGVPGRKFIEVHIANYPTQLLGCVAVGQRYGEVHGTAAVWDSEKAMVRLLDRLKEEDVMEIEIVCAIEGETHEFKN